MIQFVKENRLTVYESISMKYLEYKSHIIFRLIIESINTHISAMNMFRAAAAV
jgi:hypothetical protein